MFFHLLWSFHVLGLLPVCREMEIWIYDLFLKLIIAVERKCGITRTINERLTITDRAALVLRLNGSGAGQDRTDDWITDDSPLLAAAGETLVVVWGPAGAVSVVSVLEETGLWVFLQLFRIFGEEVIELPILLLPPGPELTGVWHMDLDKNEGKD